MTTTKSTPTTGLSAWLDGTPDGVQQLPDGTYYKDCRCGERIEASTPDLIRAMQAGHWMFDESHAKFVAAEVTA